MQDGESTELMQSRDFKSTNRQDKIRKFQASRGGYATTTRTGAN